MCVNGNLSFNCRDCVKEPSRMIYMMMADEDSPDIR